jgi:hypothetical protein
MALESSCQGLSNGMLHASRGQVLRFVECFFEYIESSATGYFLITRILRHCSSGGPDLIRKTEFTVTGLTVYIYIM